MSYDLNGLVCFAKGGVENVAAPTTKNLYSYVTDDTKATVEGASYFNAAAGLVKIGDLIFVHGDIDGTPWTKQYIVATNDGATVTVTGAG